MDPPAAAGRGARGVYAIIDRARGASHLASPEVDLDTHIRDVVGVPEFEDLRAVALVGHSYGGPALAVRVDCLELSVAADEFARPGMFEDVEYFGPVG